MEATGFGLAVIAEVRTLVNSAKTRIANIRNGPNIFKGLTQDLDRLLRHIVEVETHIQSAPAAIPACISTVFDESLSSVRDILSHCNSSLDALRSTAFPGSSSRMTARVRTLFRRTSRATAISNTMNDVQPQLQRASNQLLVLMSTLATGLTIQDVVVPKLDSLRDTANMEEVYIVSYNTPALPDGAHLNFDAMDAEGNLCTPEGLLKSSILFADSTSTVTAAAGTITHAHGVVGMAGVGKTIALQALAFDKDIRTRFPDGIQYLALGQGASLSTAIDAIAKIMRLSGASASVSAVEGTSLLHDAVDYAVAWFRGKICLFLVDDLWPTSNCKTGFLYELRQILRSCPQSRMAITTRNTLIADAAGHTVDFAPRAPLGPVSVSIFMMHAARGATINAPQEPTGELRRSIATILKICAGLPIALAVCGSTVAFLAKEKGNFEGACDVYALRLGRQRTELGEEQGPGGSSLNVGITLSLTILEAEFVQLKSRNAVDLESTIADLYTSLCVLRHQGEVPISALSCMWQVDKEITLEIARLFNKMSLCKLSFQGLAESRESVGSLLLHDLQLDFCKRQAETMKTSSLWHARILSGYTEQLPISLKRSLSDEKGDSFEYALLAYRPRPWWSVPNDRYIHLNLARHLVSANLGIELAALLLDARWTHVRFQSGGILSLKSDFDCLLTLGGDVFPLGVGQEFEFIRKAIQVSWGRVREGKRTFLLLVCGRLLIFRTNSAVVRSYMKSIEEHTPMPYLVPVNSFFPDLRSALIMEIPVAYTCSTVECSPCGRFIAAGTIHNVIVLDASTGDFLKRLNLHSAIVEFVTFAGGSKRIVIRSKEHLVAVWEWETSRAHVLGMHNKEVSGIAVSSDGSMIFSCSGDRSLMISDASTGALIDELLQKSDVYCVAVSHDDQYIAIGLADGTAKVLNSTTGRTVFENSEAHLNKISLVAFSASDKLLATRSLEAPFRVWDTATWTCVGGPFCELLCEDPCITFSPVEQQFAAGLLDDTIELWNACTGRKIWRSPNMHSDVRSFAFTPDGERIISASFDGVIRIWDTRVEAEANEQEYGHDVGVSAVAISHDGLQVVSGSSLGQVRLWDSCTGKQIGRPMVGHTNSVQCVSFSHDGRQVVSGADKTIRLWDTETSNQMGTPLEGHSDLVKCVSFSSDGQPILSGSDDKTVRIWDAKSGHLIGNALLGHTAGVAAVSESDDGSHVVSRDSAGAVFIRNQVSRTIVFQSTQQLSDSGNEMTHEEAESIIRSCGQETPNLWPNSFPPYPEELYCLIKSVISNVPIEDTFLLNLPSMVNTWRYNETKSLFVAGLSNGAVAICKLKGATQN